MATIPSTQSPPFETVEAALMAGITQNEIDVWYASEGGGERTMTTSEDDTVANEKETLTKRNRELEACNTSVGGLKTMNKSTTRTLEQEAMSSFAGTKTLPPPTTTTDADAVVPIFYTEEFPHPKHLPDDIFVESVRLMQEGRRRNAYNHHTGDTTSRPACLHDRCCAWNPGVCSDCKAKLSQARIDEEKRIAQRLRREDRTLATVQPHHRRIHGLAIRVDVLLKFTYDHDCWDWSTYEVVRNIIVPTTREKRCRYADLPGMKQYVGPATVFMSHCWGARFGDLVGAACHGARSNRYVWIDIFAVRQWPGNRDDLDFRSVVNLCHAMVVSCSPVEGLKKFIMDSEELGIAAGKEFLATPQGHAAKNALPMFRLWCNVEIVAAIERNVNIVVKGGRARRASSASETYKYDVKSMGLMMTNLSYMVDVAGSKCALQADYDREMAIVAGIEGGMDRVNKIVQGVFLGAVESIADDILEIDAYVCGEKESLRNLPMEVGCTDYTANRLTASVLKAAGSGGRTNIVRELLARWRDKEEVEGKEQEQEQRAKWLRDLVNHSFVLLCASRGGHKDVVGLLLDVPGTNVNVASPNSFATALFLAVQNAHSSVVALLLARKEIHVNRPDRYGCSPFWLACQHGHDQIVSRFLAHEEIDVNQLSLGGSTPLFVACQQGHSECVRLLLARKEIDVNYPTIELITPLFSASSKGRSTEVVRLLIQHADIDLNQTDGWGTTALDVAKLQNHYEIVRLLTDALSRSRLGFETASPLAGKTKGVEEERTNEAFKK